MATITIPKKLYEALRKHGIDVETKAIEALLKEAQLDPNEEAEIHLELAQKLLNEGEALIEKDPIQAGEKLYKAAEESVKALAIHYNLKDILEKARDRGRWTVTELEKAVLQISSRAGEWFRRAWDAAWTLHVWGFHEAKFDSEDVREREPDIKRIIEEAIKAIGRDGENKDFKDTTDNKHSETTH
ncbi:PaREP1 family protein [Caldivirga maquilingensis]|uniref:PaREP1 protein n=1 Tax=Caldivirga maquilingensis (strain ATCC 700844 / DSM 13496 / JCM 10307 / IC-167) TaxID=397948 RepID=A8M946_CALMQ|nr:PaREP1 family protein [Caldivirga maquilingensis]ABW02265.1 PaREP1 protein [Caldivirga maquilingensis IC-167]